MRSEIIGFCFVSAPRGSPHHHQCLRSHHSRNSRCCSLLRINIPHMTLQNNTDCQQGTTQIFYKPMHLLVSVDNVHVQLRSSLISTKLFYKSVSILLLPYIQISAISPERVTVAYHEGVNGCPPSDGEVMSPVCPEHDRQCWLHWVGQPHLPVPPHWHNHLVRANMTCLYDNNVA